MIKEAIGVGESLILAQRRACEALGVPESAVTFEVVQMPVKKTFGLFGGKLAKVKALFEVSPAKLAADYLRDVLAAYGLRNFEVEAEEKEDGLALHVTGGNAKIAIGHRGDTLDAIQYLVGLVANAASETYYRVTINISDYRERRDETLKSLGGKLARRVLRTRQRIELEPMTPYERKVLHTEIAKVQGVTSWSEGEELERHLIVDLEGAQGAC